MRAASTSDELDDDRNAVDSDVELVDDGSTALLLLVAVDALDSDDDLDVLDEVAELGDVSLVLDGEPLIELGDDVDSELTDDDVVDRNAVVLELVDCCAVDDDDDRLLLVD